MPSTCSICPSLRARRCTAKSYHLRPASRDLSGSARSGNAHQHAVRDASNTKNPKTLRFRSLQRSNRQQQHALSNRLPTYLQALFHFRSARPSMGSLGLGSDVSSSRSKHLEASRHIFSSQCMQNRHQARRPMQTFISPEDNVEPKGEQLNFRSVRP